eukprot:gene6370-6602_t
MPGFTLLNAKGAISSIPGFVGPAVGQGMQFNGPGVERGMNLVNPGRRTSAFGFSNVTRRSSVGAALDARAADDSPEDAHGLFHMDFELLQRINNMDMLIDDWRRQLAEEAQAARDAKRTAAQDGWVDKPTSAATSLRGSMYSMPGQSTAVVALTPRHPGQPAGACPALQGAPEKAHWRLSYGAAALADDCSNTAQPPVWEDVIVQGDIYIKKSSGQGAAEYEARCADVGITPCKQVLQQLDSCEANMSHCKIGGPGAAPLAAALAANSCIMSLDLKDNGFDSKAVALVLSGVVTSVASQLANKQRAENSAGSPTSGSRSSNQLCPTSGASSSHPSVPAQQGSLSLSAVSSVTGGIPAAAAGSDGGNVLLVAAGTQALDNATAPDASSLELAIEQLPTPQDCKGVKASEMPPVCLGGVKAADFFWKSSSTNGWAQVVPGSGHQAVARARGISASAAEEWLSYRLGSKGAAAGSGLTEATTSQQQHRTRTLPKMVTGGSKNGSSNRKGDEPPSARPVNDSSVLLAAVAGRGMTDSGVRLLSVTGLDEVRDEDQQLLYGIASSPLPPTTLFSFNTPTPTNAEEGGQCSQPPRTDRSNSTVEGSVKKRAIINTNSCLGNSRRANRADSLAYGRSRTTMLDSASHAGLRELDLSQNALGPSGAKVIAELLNPRLHPTQFLVCLYLSKCSITEAGGIAIAGALAAGNLRLRLLDLSNNSLGNKSAIAFGDLLECSHTLRELNLGWNQIKADGVKGLAHGLSANATLISLTLCWNGLESGGGGAIGNMLAANMGLKHLDLSHCRLGPEACLLMAEGLKGNVVLEVLLLSGNDIGEDGARHLMIALAANSSLQYLGLNGSNMTSAVHDGAGSPADFNPACPDGSYQLDLSVAAERAVVLQLLGLDSACSTADLLKGITLDGKGIPSAKKANWPAMLPSRGVVSFTFASKGIKRPMGIMEQSKLTTLQRQLSLSNISDNERLDLVTMFAPFALFTCSQIASVITSFTIGPERVAAAALLFTRAADGQSQLHQLMQAMSPHDLLEWQCTLGAYAGYCWNQPTARSTTFTKQQSTVNAAGGSSNGNGIKRKDSLAAKAAGGLGSRSSAADLGQGGIGDVPKAATPLSEDQLQDLMRAQMKIPVNSPHSEGAATYGAVSDVSAADQALLALRHAAASGLVLTSSSVKVLVEAFAVQLSPHRVEVAVVCWPVTVDRSENYWTVLYCLQGIEQSNLLQRLGPWRLFSPAHASCHWVLDLSHPGHEEVARKLVALAVNGGELPNFWNLRLRGVNKQVNENQNMWGMLTAESFVPVMEFDFLGPDAWAGLSKSEKELAAMAAGDKLELRSKQAARLEAIRAKQLYPYSCDGSGYLRQPWATYEALMAPQLIKTPWVAAWDRLLRVLLRLELRAGGISRDSSSLWEAFQAAAASYETMPAAADVAVASPSKAGAAGQVQLPTGSAPGSLASGAGSTAASDLQANPAFGGVSAAADKNTAGAAGAGQLCISAAEFEEGAVDGRDALAARPFSRGASKSQSNGASSTAANIEAMFDRGINFSEFVSIIMKEPPSSGCRAQAGVGGGLQLATADEAVEIKAAPKAKKGGAAGQAAP